MRINALGNTATDFASDDYLSIDGTTNGSRKMLGTKAKDIILTDVGQVRFYQGLIDSIGEISSLNFSSRCRTDLFDCSLFQTKILSVGLADSLYYRVIFYNDYAISSSNLIATDSNTNWQTEPKKIKIPYNAKGFAICVKKSDDSDLSPKDCTTLSFELANDDIPINDFIPIGDYLQQNISTLGTAISSTSRCRSRDIFVGGSKLLYVKQSKTRKTRIVFFNTNTINSVNLVDTPSNQSWTEGDFFVPVPSGATHFCVVTAFINDGTFLPSDVDVKLYADSFSKKPYLCCVPLTNGLFDVVTNRATSNWNAVDANFGFVSVKVGSGWKYRVVFYKNIWDLNSNYIKTDTSDTWQTKSCSTPIPYEADHYYIVVAKTDDSDIDVDNVDVTYFLSNNSEFGKVISILGDSISTFGGSVLDPNSARFAGVGDPTYVGNRCRYPQSNLVTDVNNTYWMKLINSLGLELGINDSWAGSRVSNTSPTDTGDVGPNRCISSETRIGHLGENGTPDIILVNAGTNDIGNNATLGTFNYEDPSNYTDGEIAALDVSTFADAYRAMLIRLQKTYPTARIIVMLPNYTTSYYNPQKEDQYCEIIKEACDYFGVPWIDMRTAGITIFNRSTYLPDGIHYNAAGMGLIFEKVKIGFEINL